MGNFVDDSHATMLGIVLGTLMKAGIPAYPVLDGEGNYTPKISLRLDTGHAELMDVVIEVKGDK